MGDPLKTATQPEKNQLERWCSLIFWCNIATWKVSIQISGESGVFSQCTRSIISQYTSHQDDNCFWQGNYGKLWFGPPKVFRFHYPFACCSPLVFHGVLMARPSLLSQRGFHADACSGGHISYVWYWVGWVWIPVPADYCRLLQIQYDSIQSSFCCRRSPSLWMRESDPLLVYRNSQFLIVLRDSSDANFHFAVRVKIIRGYLNTTISSTEPGLRLGKGDTRTGYRPDVRRTGHLLSAKAAFLDKLVCE